MDYKKTYKQWLSTATDSEVKTQLKNMSQQQIEEAFCTNLTFGTGGIRALMGAGTNRLNLYTMIKIAEGTANYLYAKKLEGEALMLAKLLDADHRTQGRENIARASKIKVVICYDNRNNSAKFARLCAAVFAAKGIESVISKTCNPTPYLSFMVRHLQASGGVMITASHNPKEYNGYKLYDRDGCQLTDGDSKIVSHFMSAADPFLAKLKPFLHHVKSKEITVTSCTNAYLSAVNDSLNSKVYGYGLAQKNNLKNRKSISEDGVMHGENLSRVFPYSNANAAYNANKGEIRIVYSPLCGTGGVLTPKLLSKIATVFTVDKQLKPDGNFSFCDIPNPENPLAYTLAIECARDNKADIIIATDPDADRMGVMVLDGQNTNSLNPKANFLKDNLTKDLMQKTKNSTSNQTNITNNADNYGYKFLTGNQIGVLLSYFLLTQNQKFIGTNNYVNNPVIVSTVVSTGMVDRIAANFNAKVKRVLTGFKYIGETIKRLEDKGEANRFMLGFEDSHGFLSGDYVRDKDGLQASMLITLFAKALKANNKTLLDVLDELYKKYGYYKHKTLSLRFEGASGSQKIKDLIANLRQNGFSELEVTKTIDYVNGYNGLYPTDMLEFITKNGSVIIRPSGTEPLLKVYLTAIADSENDSDKILNDYQNICKNFFD